MPLPGITGQTLWESSNTPATLGIVVLKTLMSKIKKTYRRKPCVSVWATKAPPPQDAALEQKPVFDLHLACPVNTLHAGGGDKEGSGLCFRTPGSPGLEKSRWVDISLGGGGRGHWKPFSFADFVPNKTSKMPKFGPFWQALRAKNITHVSRGC